MSLSFLAPSRRANETFKVLKTFKVFSIGFPPFAVASRYGEPQRLPAVRFQNIPPLSCNKNSSYSRGEQLPAGSQRRIPWREATANGKTGKGRKM